MIGDVQWNLMRIIIQDW